MKSKAASKTRIKVKKIGIRGDEVAILFFSLVFLAFLFISFFRLFAIGKLFDDFIFLFLFGWSKYLVYLFLFIIIVPIFFNYYFRLKFSLIVATFVTLFITSWLVLNISILTNQTTNNLWWKLNFYQFSRLSDYLQKWWDSTIINNYHGFFAQPLSFANWNDSTSFFPNFAAGGIVANFLLFLSAYGGFVSSWILNLACLFISLSWLFFARPWLLFLIIFFCFWPIINYFKKRRIKKLSEKSLAHKTLLDHQAENSQKLPLLEQEKIPDVPSNKQTGIGQNILQESGTLTPFGKLTQDETKEINPNKEHQD